MKLSGNTIKEILDNAVNSEYPEVKQSRTFQVTTDNPEIIGWFNSITNLVYTSSEYKENFGGLFGVFPVSCIDGHEGIFTLDFRFDYADLNAWKFKRLGAVGIQRIEFTTLSDEDNYSDESSLEGNIKEAIKYIRTACNSERGVMKAIGRDGHLNGILMMASSIESSVSLLQEQLSKANKEIADLKRVSQAKEDYLQGILV